MSVPVSRQPVRRTRCSAAFSRKQPDLNWQNPKVRDELYRMIRWWAARGVGGFRLDVVDLFGKDPDKTHQSILTDQGCFFLQKHKILTVKSIYKSCIYPLGCGTLLKVYNRGS